MTKMDDMNREIKFKIYQEPGALPYIQTECYSGDYYPKCCQFTGIRDVNGIEIYEGDIVVPTKFKDIPNVVKYIGHGFYRVKGHNGKTYANILGSCEIKVIGNIYEEPKIKMT